MSEIKAKKTLIGSIHKSLDNATLTGKLKLKNLFLLNIINKYLYSCDSVLTFFQSEYLKNLAIAIENTDKNICIYREQLSNFTNIIGCRNCTSLNENNVIVVNTPPQVDNETIPLPSTCINPTIQDNAVNYNCNLSGMKLSLSFFTTESFFNYEGSSAGYKNLKITKLPEYGVLFYNGEPISVNTIIDLTVYTDELTYIQLINNEDEENPYDYFEFQISSVTYPNCYSNIAYKEIALCEI